LDNRSTYLSGTHISKLVYRHSLKAELTGKFVGYVKTNNHAIIFEQRNYLKIVCSYVTESFFAAIALVEQDVNEGGVPAEKVLP
jgi:hypothetical protein